MPTAKILLDGRFATPADVDTQIAREVFPGADAKAALDGDFTLQPRVQEIPLAEIDKRARGRRKTSKNKLLVSRKLKITPKVKKRGRFSGPKNSQTVISRKPKPDGE